MNSTPFKARLEKMKTALHEVVQYRLPTSGGDILLNDWIGTKVTLKFAGRIFCVACEKQISKSYQGGYCFQCLQSRPETDMCQVKPELCHYDRGTCRDAEWGRRHCFIPHVVYLARSSGTKVGITRENPPQTRWMDQGAIEGMVIAEVPDRKTSGMIESVLAQHIKDKTDFRKMLRGEVVEESLLEVYHEIIDHVPMQYQIYLLEDPKPVSIRYPLAVHPDKIKTVTLDKECEVSGTLTGIKGQYLVFDEFVFNIRAHSGYEIEIFGGQDKPKPASPAQEKPMNLFEFMS